MMGLELAGELFAAVVVYTIVASYAMGWLMAMDDFKGDEGWAVFFGLIWPVSGFFAGIYWTFYLIGRYPYTLAKTRKMRSEMRAAKREGREFKPYKMVDERIPESEWTSQQRSYYFQTDVRPTRKVKVEL